MPYLAVWGCHTRQRTTLSHLQHKSHTSTLGLQHAILGCVGMPHQAAYNALTPTAQITHINFRTTACHTWLCGDHQAVYNALTPTAQITHINFRTTACHTWLCGDAMHQAAYNALTPTAQITHINFRTTAWPYLAAQITHINLGHTLSHLQHKSHTSTLGLQHAILGCVGMPHQAAYNALTPTAQITHINFRTTACHTWLCGDAMPGSVQRSHAYSTNHTHQL